MEAWPSELHFVSRFKERGDVNLSLSEPGTTLSHTSERLASHTCGHAHSRCYIDACGVVIDLKDGSTRGLGSDKWLGGYRERGPGF